MRAAEDLIDFRLESDIDRILGFFNDGIDYDETPAVFEHAQYFGDDAGRVPKMMQTE